MRISKISWDKSLGLVLSIQTINAKEFEFLGQITGTWSLRLDFLTKMGNSHEGTLSSGLVAGTLLGVPTINHSAPRSPLNYLKLGAYIWKFAIH